MNLPLIFHLAGALASALLVLATIVALLARRSRLFKPLAKTLAIAGVYQIVSGAVLSYVSQASVLSFCARIGSYLAIILLTELILIAAIKRSSVAGMRVAPVTVEATTKR
ncbi:MAG: hypothetical protein U0517_02945 [Candidatus Andersenbacteria bacterium]